MEAFECTVGTAKRDAVKDLSLKKRLVRPWRVGTVSALCAKQNYCTKKDWKDDYFASGAERNRLIALLPEEEQCIVKNPVCPENIWTTYPHLAALNFHYGRTEEQLNFLGNSLFDGIEKKPTLKWIEKRDLRYLMKYFVIDEAWNDLQLRKQNTNTQLRKILQDQALSIDVRELDGKTGEAYAVDSELYLDGVLKCAVQIKPLDYKQSFVQTEKVKKHNQEKIETYSREKGVKVFCVYAKKDGTCFNPEIIAEITSACHQRKVC